MNKQEIKVSLIAAGVKNLKTFGYPDVNEDNILKDKIYSAFFKNMLEENRGISPTSDEAIFDLLKKIKNK